MLKLKRVEIHGFKSFFDRTEMRFNGAGIAAVVGPNGCGKSNLSDAISWVLGEQSAKSLRGTRMEDVIFAGTRDRKPLGMASVTMTLVDPQAHAVPGDPKVVEGPAPAPAADGAPVVEVHAEGNGNGTGHGTNGTANGHSHAPIGHSTLNGQGKTGEVTITRRLFRSGESEYLINGKTARLRDIQDLFMGTGLGPESYAIIEQGRIGQILSNKPADRRAVIEEAAGITKFKTRKRLAEAKLEGAKQNLSRVFDILEEVNRQVNSLKRQAAKAKRYEELRGELVTHLRQALTGRYQLLEREAAKLAIELNLASNEFQSLAGQVGEKEKEQAALQEQAYQTEAELTAHRTQLGEHRVNAERTKGRLESQARQIASIEQRLTQGETEISNIEKRQAQQQQELEQFTRSLAELEEQTMMARQKLGVKNAERERLQGELRDRERGLEAARQQVLRLLGEASSLRNQLAQVDEYLAAMDRDTARTERDEQSALADLQRLETAKAELGEKRKARQLQLESVTDRRKQVEEDLQVRKPKLADARKKLDEARAELSRQKARRDSLEEILSHHSYATHSVKRLFTAIEKGQAGDFRPAGVLADFMEVSDATYEKAAEEFLHEELEYVVVSDWQQADRGLTLMRSDADGRATFLVHPKEQAAQAEPGPRPEGVAGRLSDVLKLTNGLTHAPSHLIPRLANCFLVAEHETAQRLAPLHPGSHFLLPDGVSYSGYAVSGGKRTGSGPLALKRELRELSHRVAARQKDADAAVSLIQHLEEEIALLTEDLERLRVQQQTQEKDVLVLDQEQRKLNEESSRANSRLSVARLELDRLRKERTRSEETRDRNRQLVREKEEARGAQEIALEQNREELTGMQARLAQVTEEYSTLRADLAGFEERRRSEQSSKTRLENQIRENNRRREDLSAEIERLGVERNRLLNDNIELDARSSELAQSIADSEKIVAELAAREAQHRSELAALEESLKAMRAESQAAQERRQQTEVALVKRQSDLKYLDETSQKELSVPVSELAANVETVLDEEGLVAAEQKYREVRAKIDSLGPVNPDALQEFQESQQRYDFLNVQRQDLLDSIRDTEKAIHEIDIESRKRFGEAFEVINNHFREMFKILFGGGIGEMRLTDADNLNESGIDIVASPPGKKLQNVLLLSGGEKSLTAMALLMAIFRYQPSPFCILDEVDAPLDEPNILRLTNLIGDMSKQTQFIVITHAKRTMEAAQSLYGVTMQEPGVSKLVSVKFQAMAEPAAPVPPPLPPSPMEPARVQ